MIKYKSDSLAYYKLHFRMPGDDLMSILKEHRPDIFDALPEEYSMKGLYMPEGEVGRWKMWRRYHDTWNLFYPFIYKFDSNQPSTTK